MKIKITRNNFIDALKKVQNVVSSKGTMPIIHNVLMNAQDGILELTATDLDVSVRAKTSCEVELPGSTTLPVKFLVNAVVKLADGELLIDVDSEDCARITAGTSTIKIVGLPAADFPPLPEDTETYAYVIPQQTFRDMLRKTAYAASMDETRKTLKGVFTAFKDGKITMAATDGRRLALVEHELEFPADAEREVILPLKLVAELTRSLGDSGDLRIVIQKSQISFSTNELLIYSKVLDEVYPNYRQVIPRNCNEHVTIDRKLLFDALDRASVMVSIDASKTSSTKFIFEENKLIVLSQAGERGEVCDQVPIKYTGTHIEISFNPSFIMDPLKAIDDDEVIIDLIDGSSPAIIRCSVPFIYVMMPLRIN